MAVFFLKQSTLSGCLRSDICVLILVYLSLIIMNSRCLKEDPATMSLLQRCLDPEKTLGLVDVLYTAVFDINRWKERKWVTIQTLILKIELYYEQYVYLQCKYVLRPKEIGFSSNVTFHFKTLVVVCDESTVVSEPNFEKIKVLKLIVTFGASCCLNPVDLCLSTTLHTIFLL